MKKDKKMLKSASLITGVVLTGSLSAFGSEQTKSNLLESTSMGSGAEVRSEIMDLNAPNVLHNESTYKFGELKCGEGKCGEGEKKAEKKKGEKAEGKTSEAKCGEGKCGEGEKKSEKKEAKKAEEGKTSEAKCGEGKCG